MLRSRKRRESRILEKSVLWGEGCGSGGQMPLGQRTLSSMKPHVVIQQAVTNTTEALKDFLSF